MAVLGAEHDLDDTALWRGLTELLGRLVPHEARDTRADEFLDALTEVLGADRVVVFLAYADGETVPVNARGEGRALSARERQEVSRTLVRQVEASGEAVTWSVLDQADASQSFQAFGILAAFAVPLDARVLSVDGEGARRGVLYVDFRDPSKLVSPRLGEFLQVAATLLAAIIGLGQRLESAKEALRVERLRVEPQGVRAPLERLLAYPSLAALRREVESCLVSDAPILITGESGTGKTALARALAEASGRVPVVRATLGGSDDLNTITSELFGHEKGSFSGALTRRVGLVEYADGGTLIFDEVLNLPRTAQQLLLDFTQFGTYRPLGWGRPEPRESRVRLVCATNGDLEAAMAQGAFRADLYYRIATCQLHVPPLRERREDLPALARDCLAAIDPARGWRLSPGLERTLGDESLGWPGNFRQLEAVLRRARNRAVVESADADLLTVAHVEAKDLGTAVPPVREPQPEPPPPETAQSWSELQRLRTEFDEREKEAIRQALERCGGVVSRAARELGLPRTSLLGRIAAFGLHPRSR